MDLKLDPCGGTTSLSPMMTPTDQTIVEEDASFRDDPPDFARDMDLLLTLQELE